jgi:hypothetical protein
MIFGTIFGVLGQSVVKQEQEDEVENQGLRSHRSVAQVLSISTAARGPIKTVRR